MAGDDFADSVDVHQAPMKCVMVMIWPENMLRVLDIGGLIQLSKCRQLTVGGRKLDLVDGVHVDRGHAKSDLAKEVRVSVNQVIVNHAPICKLVSGQAERCKLGMFERDPSVLEEAVYSCAPFWRERSDESVDVSSIGIHWCVLRCKGLVVGGRRMWALSHEPHGPYASLEGKVKSAIHRQY